MIVEDLGTMAYRDAWARQEEVHARVLAGGAEAILLVEHPPVITFGRRSGQEANVVASDDVLKACGVEVVQSDRGGDVTFHGPGQIVAYPIIRLVDHKLSVGGYVHRLEDVIIATLAHFGIEGRKDPSAVGVWANDAKVAAIGVRVKRGVTMHGLAVNVNTDLTFFDLIVPCGLKDRKVTSMRERIGDRAVVDDVKSILVERLEQML